MWFDERDEWEFRRDAQWNEFLAAHQRGDGVAWAHAYFGRVPGVFLDLLTGKALPPGDDDRVAPGDVLQSIALKEDVVSHAVVRCPACKRMYVQRERGKNVYDCFAFEPELD